MSLISCLGAQVFLLILWELVEPVSQSEKMGVTPAPLLSWWNCETYKHPWRRVPRVEG